MLAEYVDQLDAHGFDIKTGVLAQIEQDLETVDVEEARGKLRRCDTFVVATVEEKDFEKLEHLKMEASTRFHCQAFRDELDLVEDLFSTTCEDVFEDSSDWFEVPVDVVDRKVPAT